MRGCEVMEADLSKNKPSEMNEQELFGLVMEEWNAIRSQRDKPQQLASADAPALGDVTAQQLASDDAPALGAVTARDVPEYK